MVCALLLLLFATCAHNSPTAPKTKNPETIPETVPEATPETAVDGLANFRDLGGYNTASGKKVKTGLLYRSNEFYGNLTEKGKSQLSALNLEAVYDLRDAAELVERPDERLDGAQYYNTSIPYDTPDPTGMTEKQFYVAVYQSMVDLQTTNPAEGGPAGYNSLKTILEGALNTEGKKAILWHCASGKDRTGFVSAIFLSMLGVDNETVTQEYLKSNAALGTNECKAEYVDVCLGGLQKTWGSVDNYLVSQVGMTPAQLDALRGLYLE
jgi:protein-tyrosine phosphatase